MSYSTLGEGKSTKILFTRHGHAETITSCPNTTARALASRLDSLRDHINAALYDVAVAANGTPVQARRHLLSVYDTGNTSPSPEWVVPERYVTAVRDAAADCADSVRKAIRGEVAKILTGLDDVLVPAVITHDGRKRPCIHLIINDSLDAAVLRDEVSPDGTLSVGPDDDVFPVGGPTVEFAFPSEIVAGVWGSSPVITSFGEWPVEDIDDEAGEHYTTYPIVRVDHLTAWMRHNTPDLLPATAATAS